MHPHVSEWLVTTIRPSDPAVLAEKTVGFLADPSRTSPETRAYMLCDHLANPSRRLGLWLECNCQDRSFGESQIVKPGFGLQSVAGFFRWSTSLVW